MTVVLTKTKSPQRRPKCQETAAITGRRCKFNGSQYVGDKFVCWRHAQRNGGA